jgi:DNA-binding MarR family transcriptional regulator
MPDDIALKILRKIGEGNTYQAKIAEDLRISAPRLNQRIKTLERKGYIRREVKDAFVALYLTDLGIKAISEEARVLPDPLIRGLTKRKFQRLNQHKWALKFSLLTPQQPDMPAKILQRERIAYNDANLLNQDSGTFVWEDIQAMLTPESLIIHYPEDAYRDSGYNPYIFKLELAPKLFKYALRLEQRLSIKLKRTEKGTLEAEIMTSHLANEGDWGAESLPQRKRIISYDEKDGKARFGFEFSDGIPEAEAWHEDHDADDMYKWQKFLTALTQHGFDADNVMSLISNLAGNQEALRALREEDRQLLHEVIVILKEYGEKLNLHLPVLDSMLKAQQSQEQKDKATTEVMLRLTEATNKLSAKIDAIATKPKPSVWLRMKNAIKRLMTTNK